MTYAIGLIIKVLIKTGMRVKFVAFYLKQWKVLKHLKLKCITILRKRFSYIFDIKYLYEVVVI